MTGISTKIVDFFVREKIIEKEDYEIYLYGLEVLAENMGMTLAFLLMGIVIGRGWETGIYLSVFCGLRRYCGGYHAKTKRGCHCASFLTYMAFLFGCEVIGKIDTVFGGWALGLYIFCFLAIWRLAPVEHPNKPLTDVDRKRNRKKSLVGTILLGCLMILMNQKLPKVSFAILVTLIDVALLMIIGRRENNKKA
ncbi:MAG: accessory gene regulator B family protein [Lachnospiraceae bacterium]|nr:accessory gene regulator B family protein [Lachnospiraceae bacterium]